MLRRAKFAFVNRRYSVGFEDDFGGQNRSNPMTIIVSPIPLTTPETVPTVCINVTGSFDLPAIVNM